MSTLDAPISVSSESEEEYRFITDAGKVFEQSSGPTFGSFDNEIVDVDLNSSSSASEDNITKKKARSCKGKGAKKAPKTKKVSKNSQRDCGASGSSSCSNPDKKVKCPHGKPRSEDSSDSDLQLTPLVSRRNITTPNCNPFLIKDDDDFIEEVITPVRHVVLPLKLKLRYQAKIERIEIEVDAPMSKVYGIAAERFNIPEDRLTIHKDGQAVARTTTPKLLSLNISHILDCYRKEVPSVCEPVTEDLIQLKIQSKDRKSTAMISIKKTDTMRALMERYAALKNVSVCALKFYFDGDLLNEDDTPSELDIEGGEIIDVISH